MKSKIINLETFLQGGIGNQFYIYCAAIMVKNKIGEHCNLIANISNFYTNKKEIRDLGIFKLFNDIDVNYSCEFKTKSSNFDVILMKLCRRFIFLKSLIELFFNLKFVIEDEDLIKLMKLNQFPSRIILCGYFQSNQVIERSFMSDLRENTINEENNNSIAIHIRLGDYLNPPYNNIYYIVTKDYLLRSLDMHRNSLSSLKRIKVKVFSDDIKMAIKLVQDAYGDEVDIEYSENKSPIQDILEISTYRRRILSNSTFSILCHYLSSEGESTIPKTWYKDKPTSENLVISKSIKNKMIAIDL